MYYILAVSFNILVWTMKTIRCSTHELFLLFDSENRFVWKFLTFWFYYEVIWLNFRFSAQFFGRFDSQNITYYLRQESMRFQQIFHFLLWFFQHFNVNFILNIFFACSHTFNEIFLISLIYVTWIIKFKIFHNFYLFLMNFRQMSLPHLKLDVKFWIWLLCRICSKLYFERLC